MSLKIDIMHEQDLPAVTHIHLASFPNFFLSFLGNGFLHELYAGILQDPSGIAFVYRSKDQVLGFVAGTDDPRGLYRRLLRRRGMRFAWHAARAALKKPAIIPRLWRALARGSGEDVHEGCGTLMSIAVAPEAQGQGVGITLVTAFLETCRDRGLKEVNLTTDRLENESVNHFYLGLGFQLSQAYTTPEGREMNEYCIKLLPGKSEA